MNSDKDVFDFVVGLFIDSTRQTIKEHNLKYGTNIDEDTFIRDLYKNVYKIGNAEIEKEDKKDDK